VEGEGSREISFSSESRWQGVGAAVRYPSSKIFNMV